jgi:hypothetical protein
VLPKITTEKSAEPLSVAAKADVKLNKLTNIMTARIMLRRFFMDVLMCFSFPALLHLYHLFAPKILFQMRARTFDAHPTGMCFFRRFYFAFS